MHRILRRQLKKLGLDENAPPKDASQWQAFLQRIDTAYQQADEGLYTLKRSGDIASREMALLNRQLTRLASFPEENVGPVLRLSRNGQLEYCNTAGRTILPAWGISRVGETLHSDDAEEIKRLFNENAQKTVELSVDDIVYLLRYVPVVEEGYVNVYGTDLTVQKEFETALIKAKNLAEQSNRAKTEFLAMMSHEIRTPMNGVMGMTELLLLTELNDKQQHYANTIIKSSHALLRIIDDILDISKIDAGKLDLDNTEFALAALIHEITDLFNERLREKSLRLIVQLAEDLPDVLFTDSVRLRQILINLIGNAIKFTPAGEIKLAVSMATDKPDTLLFEVIDQGIGIETDALEHIFGTFAQADQSTTRQFGGTGLGLAIVKRLVEMMGGEVGVDSQPGQGARFWFTLYSGNDGHYTVAENAVFQPLDAAPAINGRPRILLAEDKPLNQEVVIEMLGQLGYHVETANNGLEAVNAVKNKHYDLVLMDCQMPVMDGFEACRRIRRHQQNTDRETPIVALTANAMSASAAKCQQAGMDDFIAKPVSINDLKTTIERHLRKHP